MFFTSAEQDLVEASLEVKSREPASIMQLIHKLVKDRHRELRFFSHSIEVSKTHAKAIGAILFLNQEHWGSESTATVFSVSESTREILVCLGKFVTVDFAAAREGII